MDFTQATEANAHTRTHTEHLKYGCNIISQKRKKPQTIDTLLINTFSTSRWTETAGVAGWAQSLDTRCSIH